MSEYKIAQERAESQWAETCGVDIRAIRTARTVGSRLCASVGLIPERVWRATREMRVKVNGGEQ